MRMDQLRPLSGRVILKRVEAQALTSGGLHIPEAAKETPLEGTVLAIGPDVDALAVGDVVLYPKYSGDLIECDDVEALVLDAEDVLAVIDDETWSTDPLPTIGRHVGEELEVEHRRHPHMFVCWNGSGWVTAGGGCTLSPGTECGGDVRRWRWSR